MENSTPSFTSMLNSSNSNADPQDHTNQLRPNFPQPQYPIAFPPQQFAPNFHPQYSHMFNPFGSHSNYPQVPFTQGSYHGGPYQHNSPVGSIAFFEGIRGTNSRGDESSPIGPASPVYWGEEENLRLVSAWMKNSNDPFRGNDKRGDRYWKEVAEEYNKYAPKQQRRTTNQCKNHWNKSVPFVTKFNACYDKAKRDHGSGESDDQVMDRAREEYKKLVGKKRAFSLEHWWRAVRDQPKWGVAYPIEQMTKKTRLNASGAYTSSNQESEDADVAESHRPKGRNAAKAEKGKEKSNFNGSEGTNESVHLFNELQIRKQVVAEKMADATMVQAEANKERAQAEKEMAQAKMEKAKVRKMEKYMELLDKDTSGYDEKAKERHEEMLAYFARELFG